VVVVEVLVHPVAIEVVGEHALDGEGCHPLELRLLDALGGRALHREPRARQEPSGEGRLNEVQLMSETEKPIELGIGRELHHLRERRAVGHVAVRILRDGANVRKLGLAQTFRLHDERVPVDPK